MSSLCGKEIFNFDPSCPIFDVISFQRMFEWRYMCYIVTIGTGRVKVWFFIDIIFNLKELFMEVHYDDAGALVSENIKKTDQNESKYLKLTQWEIFNVNINFAKFILL